jgi:hypothetical protein
MPSLKEIAFLARDFWRVSSGRDYFHGPQRVGAYFRDPRCYYIDFTPKADWHGAFVDEVPAIFVPALGRHLTQGVMVIQYGLGCLDRALLTGDPVALEGVRRVGEWIPRHLLPEGYLPNRYVDINPHEAFHSDNGALTMGEALSFSVRVIENRMLPEASLERLRDALRTMAASMIRPLEAAGTVLRREDDVYLCEFCRKDGYVVLNGWIFAIFGLRDYAQHSGDPEVRSTLEATLRTLLRALPGFLLPNGWTYYDNRRLICSPFYHAAHVELFDALHRLTGAPIVAGILERARAANGRLNRVRYTMVRAAAKLREKALVAGHG